MTETLTAAIDSPVIDDLSITRAIKPYLEYLKGTPFVGLTYTGKDTGETARYRLQLMDYDVVLSQWRDHLAKRLPDLSGVDLQAALELIGSYSESKATGQNSRNTRLGQYATVAPGMIVNLRDGTCELQGIQRSRVVLVPGVHKEVNSGPVVIAKNKLRKEMSQWKRFALDAGYFQSIRIGGDALEFGGGSFRVEV